jgi:hypothetical protein
MWLFLINPLKSYVAMAVEVYRAMIVNQVAVNIIPTNSSRQKKVPNLPVGVYFCRFPE